jgi:quinol monooxygenase YgiN
LRSNAVPDEYGSVWGNHGNTALVDSEKRRALGSVGGTVLVATFNLAVKAEKRAEFLSAIYGLIDRTLHLPGCSACRLSTDCRDVDAYFLTCEWQSRSDFVAFTSSRELHVLCGMRGLLSAEIQVAIDEVSARSQGSLPKLLRSS